MYSYPTIYSTSLGYPISIYIDFSTTYRSYWIYNYSTSLGYPTITDFSTTYGSYISLLDVQLQHIAWLPDHIQISLPHT